MVGLIFLFQDEILERVFLIYFLKKINFITPDRLVIVFFG
jgi:hypothetical protein